MGDSPDLLVGRLLDEPLRRTPASPLLADALADLAAAESGAQVAAVAVEHARALTGARAAALALLTTARTELVILGSTGYGCGSMGVGARLPLDAGLPITEAARSGAPVVRIPPTGGGWVAVPLVADPAGAQGALLVSLTETTPEPDVPLLSSLAGHVRQALHRARHVGAEPVAPSTASIHPVGDGPVSSGAVRTLTDVEELADVTVAVTTDVLAAGPGAVLVPMSITLRGVDIAATSQPRLADAGGDLVEVVGTAHGFWLVVADACGNDAAAYHAAAGLRTLVRTLAPALTDPAQLLDELDGLLSVTGSDVYLTAFAAHLSPSATGTRVQMASAGHPLPVVVVDGEAATLDPAAGTGLPLNLRLGQPVDAPVHELDLPAGAVLLAYTDGVTDRRERSLPEDIVADVCLRAAAFDPVTALETFLDVLAAAHGPSRDDVAAALLRIG